jgi:hypothetical protein
MDGMPGDADYAAILRALSGPDEQVVAGLAQLLPLLT